MKKIGIIGGMGPLATVELFRLIVENTASKTDAGHIRLFIDNNPQIPDRTEAILHNGQSPVSAIIESGHNLEKIGADILLIPCNTTHFFYDELSNAFHAELINMVEETVKQISENGLKTVGFLGTIGTIKGRVYDKYCQKYGVDLIHVEEPQQEQVMDFIYKGVKAGAPSYNSFDMQNITDSLYEKGCESIILGCTELCLGFEMYNVRVGSFTEPMRVLAEKAIIKAGYELVRNNQ
ncbi:MAG: amino acid racemase [Clostridia bacterium]|nr:amino acid racemase [Clostridia bacterium]